MPKKKGNSELMFSVGVPGVSYFLNRARHRKQFRYVLCKVKLPEKVYWKVAVNKGILLELKGMGKKKALKYCQHLMTCRKKISMGSRGGDG